MRNAMLVFLALATAANAAESLAISPDRANGAYALGQKATWTIVVKDNGKPAAGSIDFEVSRGGARKIASGSLALSNGMATVSESRADPGTLLLTVRRKAPDGKAPKAHYGGAAFAWERIAASAPPPDDFDRFWQGKLAELKAVPINARLVRKDSGDPAIEYCHFTLDNLGGAKVHGQMAKPAGKASLPALLQVQWAGVYPLDRSWISWHAKAGWLAVNISAHDLPIAEPADFYARQAAGPLDDYPGIGNDNRETSYFLRMFLSCRRAVDFIGSRDDWNRKALVVHGGSQGGYQALVTAGLCPEVTALAANVPAGCDHTGARAGRAPGWPNWASRTWKGRDAEKMLAASRYFDAMNFAARAKCHALVGLGLADTVCPSEGILATVNQLRGRKEVVLMPQADHMGDHQAYQDRFGPFLKAHMTP